MSRLYTKTGDNGQTNLYDMRKVDKDSLIFDVLGDLDELSAHIGVCCSLPDIQLEVVGQLRWIQNKLLDIGSDIATVKNREKITTINESDTKNVEYLIDKFTEITPKLTEFILPGVYLPDANIHVCRAVCRRTERNLWGLKKTNLDLKTEKETFIFLNRLSDYFFALSRYLSKSKEIRRSDAQNLIVIN
jgi:cob(I)alamin adenosyltransferase